MSANRELAGPATRAPVVPLEVANPPFDLGDTGHDLYERTQPVAFGDPVNRWAWAAYCSALSTILDPISVMVRDDAAGNAGWTKLASPWRCPEPWLPVLAQWAGIRISAARSMTVDELRELLSTGGPSLHRGTRAALIAAIRRFLPPGTADRLVYFEERAVVTGNPQIDAYMLRVFTFNFVEHDPEEVRAALEAAKPAGIQLVYQVRVGQTWGMLNQREDSWADVLNNYASWGDVLNTEPIEIPLEGEP